MMDNLKTARSKAGLSQAALAQKINVTKQAISLYESGARTPDHETLQKIADVLGVSINYLLGRSIRTDGADAAALLVGISFNDLTTKLNELFGCSDFDAATQEQIVQATHAAMRDRAEKLKDNHLKEHDVVEVSRDKLFEIVEYLLQERGDKPMTNDQRFVLNVISDALRQLQQHTEQNK